MNLFLTAEPANRLNDEIINICKYAVVDVTGLLKSFSEKDLAKKPVIAYINSEINNKIYAASANSRLEGVIYINRKLDNEKIQRLLNSSAVKSLGVSKACIIDNRNIPKLKNVYSLAEEVVFVSRFKKIKL